MCFSLKFSRLWTLNDVAWNLEIAGAKSLDAILAVWVFLWTAILNLLAIIRTFQILAKLMLLYQLLGSCIKPPLFHALSFFPSFLVFIQQYSLHQRKRYCAASSRSFVLEFLLLDFLITFHTSSDLFPINAVFKSCSSNVFAIFHMPFQSFKFKFTWKGSILFCVLHLHVGMFAYSKSVQKHSKLNI